MISKKVVNYKICSSCGNNLKVCCKLLTYNDHQFLKKLFMVPVNKDNKDKI
jgi:hypothetical protein